MSKPRNLSGYYFRYKNPETSKWENWCFEDLPEADQIEKLKDRSDEWKDSLIIGLANTIKKLGEQFGFERAEGSDVG